MDLPTGTVTFLFTDIEGSTRLLQELGEGYRPVQNDQMRLMREAIAESGGTVIRTEGDAFFVVFPTATGAIQTATMAQRGFAAHPWTHGRPLGVRMGIHTGEGRLGGDDYIGVDVNRAARIAAAGHGGQVLISEATHALAADALPEGVTLKDLGPHRLKDFEAPQRIYQLVIPDLPSEFPAIRTLEVPTNLPMQLTGFVGRERELGAIETLLSNHRFVTLAGPGGSGKTRVALEVAKRSVDYPDGIFFVDLSPIRDPELVASTIVESLGLRQQPSKPALETVTRHLADRRCLLLMDNFEQVTAAAPIVEAILRAAPEVRLLVTSRIRLNLSGEQEFPVPPLALPDDLSDLDALGKNEALALFRERARAVVPSFEITEENAGAIAEICVRVDGLPLAIELAAAQVRLLAPSELLGRLEHRLPLPTGAANVPERQRTLRGTIDWSYQLLDEPKRRLFARLSSFAGGGTLPAIDSICNPGEDLGGETLEGLASLLDHSLVRRDEFPEGSRFNMLETIREYARERLQSDFDLEETERRHAEYFAALVEKWGPAVRGEYALEATSVLSRDHDNVRTAIDWALRNGLARVGFRIAPPMWMFWVERGPIAQGRRAVEDVLELSSASGRDSLRAAALNALGALAYWEGDYSAARLAYSEALEIFRELGDRRSAAETLKNLAYTTGAQGNPTGAIAIAEEALEMAREVGDRTLTAEAASLLGIAWSRQGQQERALAATLEALEGFEAVGNRYWANQTLTRVGHVYMRMGRLDEAEELLHNALREAGDLSGNVGIGVAAWLLAAVAFQRKDFERALRLIGFSQAMTDRMGSTPPAQLLGDHAAHLENARRALGPQAVERLRAEGAAMSVEEAIVYGTGDS